MSDDSDAIAKNMEWTDELEHKLTKKVADNQIYKYTASRVMSHIYPIGY